jgi:predicted amino acid dehydrogenase
MDKFGFIVHPAKIEDLYRLSSSLKFIPKKILEIGLKYLSPFKVFEIKSIRSSTGQEIAGFFIGCPLLPQQMLSLDTDFVLDKITAACRVAQDLGAKIIGLGGYTSIMVEKGIAEKNCNISSRLKVPITSGNTYTAWSVFKAISDAAKKKGMDLRKSTAAVIGATGAIGSLCAKKLSAYVPRMIITARHNNKLEALKENILKLNPIEVIIERDVHAAAKYADIAIVTTSSPEALLDTNEFKDQVIICDVSVPMNVNGRATPEKNLTLIKGGLIKLPYEVHIEKYSGLAKDVVYACMAETMLLTFEKIFTAYSLGKNIELTKLDEIAGLADKHGFKVLT